MKTYKHARYFWEILPIPTLILSFCTLVQGVSSPKQLWTTVVFEKSHGSGITLSLEQQVRLRSQSPVFSQTYSEIRLGWKPAPRLALHGLSRCIFYSAETAMRMGISASLLSALGVPGHTVRWLLQGQSAPGTQTRYHCRLRSAFTIPSGTPILAVLLQTEPWWCLNDPVVLNRFRLDAGLRIRRSGNIWYDVYYRFQGDWSGIAWSGTHIIVVGTKLRR